jgi:hypothetical protein
LNTPLCLPYELIFEVKMKCPHWASGHTGRLHIVEQRDSVVTHVAFSGDPCFKIKSRDLERAGLKAVSATDALLFIDNYRTHGQLRNGLDRTDPGTCWPYSVMTGPVFVGLPGAVLAVDLKVNHHPVIGREVYVPVRDQFVPLHF